LDGDRSPTIRNFLENRADHIGKRFGPGFPARAKSAFHLKDPLIRFEPRRIKSLKIFDDSRVIDPVTGLATHPPYEAFGVAAGEGAGAADFL